MSPFPFPFFPPLFFLGKCFNPRCDNVAVVGRDGVTMFLSEMCFVVTVLPLISREIGKYAEGNTVTRLIHYYCQEPDLFQ